MTNRNKDGKNGTTTRQINLRERTAERQNENNKETQKAIRNNRTTTIRKDRNETQEQHNRNDKRMQDNNGRTK